MKPHESQSIFRFAFLPAGLGFVGLICWMSFSDKSTSIVKNGGTVAQGSPKPEQAATTGDADLGSKSRKKVLGSPERAALLSKLKDAVARRADPEEFISLVPELRLTGILADADVLAIYKSAIYRFNVSELIGLTKIWPDEGTNGPYSGHLMAIGELLKERNDPSQAIAYLKGIPTDNKSRGYIVSKLVQKMGMFSPEEIKSFIKEIDPVDYDALGQALVFRSELNGDATVTNKDRTDMIQKYLNVIENPRIIAHLVAKSISISAPQDPLGTLDWVSRQDPQVVAICDTPLINALLAEHPKEATEYVNGILAGNDQNRADRAIESMTEAYSKRDPAGAWNWVSSLPEDSRPTEQVVATAFGQLLKSDQEAAEEVANSVKNPWIKDIITSVMRSQ